MNANRNLSSINFSKYNESEALQQLLKAAHESLTQVNDDYDSDNYHDVDAAEFTITVNGIQTAFCLGGPQFRALCAFISCISDENFYRVDFNKCTVEEE